MDGYEEITLDELLETVGKRTVMICSECMSFMEYQGDLICYSGVCNDESMMKSEMEETLEFIN